jgi:hypothetical protein
MNRTHGLSNPVEVDIYETLTPPVNRDVFLGVDIGSTSTKAVLLDTRARVLAGFYTGTAGRPVAAVQRLFSAINDMAVKEEIPYADSGRRNHRLGKKIRRKDHRERTSFWTRSRPMPERPVRSIPRWTPSSKSAGRTASSPP